MQAKGRLLILLILSIYSFVLGGETAPSVYPFEKSTQAAQFQGLLKELRCLVCQNQDLADSNAGLAKDLRDQIYQMVSSGQSDQEIMTYLTKRYGDFILFQPPLKGLTALLWFGPVFFVLLGFVIFGRTMLHRRGGDAHG